MPGGRGGLAPPPLCWPRPECGSCPQGAVQAGQLKVPPGYHPLDVEKEWGKLHVAILEREKLLRSEFERWVAPWRLRSLSGGALRWQGSHPRMSHCLGGNPPPNPRGGKPTLGWRDSGLQAGGEARRSGHCSATRSRRAVPSRWSLVLGLRLECLQRIVSKLQMEAGLCEEQLNQADALLQSVRGGGRVGLGEGGRGMGGGGDTPAPPPGPQLLPPGLWPADC